MTLDGQPAPAESASAKYWRALDGETYEEMIRLREATGAAAYRQQESLIRRWLSTLVPRFPRPVDLLEFGCGFGRHAQYLSSMPEVRYHGYDFSAPMVRPLLQNPPPGLLPVEHRVFVGDVGVLDGRHFDAVFTVSVLIHNPPAQVGPLIERLCSLTRDAGEVCLVENQLVPFDVYENDWHDGCWLHAFASKVPQGWELLLLQGGVDTHDLYLLRRSSAGGVFGLTPDFQRGAALSQDDLWQLGRAKLERWARGTSAVLEQGIPGEGGARFRALEEKVAVLERSAARRKHLDAIADSAARARASSSPVRVLERYDTIQPPPLQPLGVEVAAPLDTRWAHEDARFARVLHVCHREWFGIRAACGFSPGRKVAVTSARALSTSELRQVIDLVEAGLIERVVLHGYSGNFPLLARALREMFGRDLGIAAVWHGSTAQFHFDEEHAAFADLVSLVNERTIDWLGSVKPGLSELSPAVFARTLINYPPSVTPSATPNREPNGRAFVPLPNDWRKNFFTNLYAVGGSSLIREVMVSADFKLREGLPIAARVVRIPRPSRQQVFQLIGDSEIVLNASLSECQPMVALESASLRVPCITCRLGIDELDSHPYQRLAQVGAVDSIPAVRSAAERLVRLKRDDPHGLSAMIDDYRRTVMRLAADSWAEFLHL
jgi:SAM-dependent methyltransferase